MDRAVLQFLASFAIILRIYDALHLQQTRHFIADHQSICQLRRSAACAHIDNYGRRATATPPCPDAHHIR